MKINVYLVKDENNNTVKNFTSEYKALDFVTYNRKFHLERIEVELPTIAFREIYHNNLKDPTTLVVKTLKQLVEEHICFAIDATKGNKAKAARLLDMSPTNLVHKLKQMNRGY